MSAKLLMSTRVYDAIPLIQDGTANPVIDLGNTRYHISLANLVLGCIVWTPFDLVSQQLIGEYSYSYPWEGATVFHQVILGPSSKHYPQSPIITEFPSYPAPALNGSVIP